MTIKPLNMEEAVGRDSIAKYIANTWQKHHSERREAIEAWKEVRNYVFATDTTTTSNSSLPWKNKTTIPKLCQIRDNLNSNYISALFPNDDWIRWEGHTLTDSASEKAKTIQAYMANKTRISNFRQEVGKLVLDYIDYGNAFATTDFIRRGSRNKSGELVKDYVGPVVKRISPYDIVFNPLANSFRDSWKIVRQIVGIGEFYAMAEDEPNNGYAAALIEKRKSLVEFGGRVGFEDLDKADGFMMDGFGSYQNYLDSGFVELLIFYGDLFDKNTGTLYRNHRIVIADRMWVVENEPINDWHGKAPIFHAGWRKRPDNLWSMGPLENLVGMQYRIDHIENVKSDAFDLAIMPPLVIKGEVEQFTWGPNAEIHIDENGDVTELAKNVQWVLQAESAIDRLEMRMEQYAGAPREAMGIRTPGEKTAFEVRELQNAAGRIFQEKVTTFEVEMLEPVLNSMFEQAKRNMDGDDVIKVLDNDIGVSVFQSITKEDITASGILRPIGARHFAANANMAQTLTQLSNTPIWQQISPHISTKKLAAAVEDLLNLNRFDMMSPNVGLFEQQELQRLHGQTQEDLMMEQTFTSPE